MMLGGFLVAGLDIISLPLSSLFNFLYFKGAQEPTFGKVPSSASSKPKPQPKQKKTGKKKKNTDPIQEEESLMSGNPESLGTKKKTGTSSASTSKTYKKSKSK